MVNDTVLITKYIATWGWQILAMLFLSIALVLFALPRSLRTSVLYVACFLIFVGCQYKSLLKKREVFGDV